MTFFDRLTLALRRKGMSQAQLARLSGLAESTISRLSSVEHPRRGTVIQLANAIGVSVDWLAFGKGEPDDMPPVQETRASENSDEGAAIKAILNRFLLSLTLEEASFLKGRLRAVGDAVSLAAISEIDRFLAAKGLGAGKPG